jgi:putative acetyltransferase
VITIRAESPADAAGIHAVNEQAFGQPMEANLVDRLRKTCDTAVSLVADEDGLIVGHILFTPVVVEAGSGPVAGMGLAPMAVLPNRQRQGIGSGLVAEGVEILRSRQCPFVVVVGHPEYYPRFGFERASRHRLESQWDGIPDDAFMVLVLDPDAMSGVSGVARYRREFDEA